MDIMSNMHITYNKENGTGHLKLDGDLDIVSKRLVDAYVKNILDQCNQLEIHLDNVDYMDSSGLSTLFGISHLITKSGKSLIISGANDRIKNLFKMTSFEEFIERQNVDNKIKKK